MSEPEDRIARALDIAMRSGQTDGAHHKAWVIDQMVRALTDCPLVQCEALDFAKRPYKFEAQGESEEYRLFVTEHNQPEGGWDTYAWSQGIAP